MKKRFVTCRCRETETGYTASFCPLTCTRHLCYRPHPPRSVCGHPHHLGPLRNSAVRNPPRQRGCRLGDGAFRPYWLGHPQTHAAAFRLPQHMLQMMEQRRKVQCYNNAPEISPKIGHLICFFEICKTANSKFNLQCQKIPAENLK